MSDRMNLYQVWSEEQQRFMTVVEKHYVESMISALTYLRQTHGDLPGVDWNRFDGYASDLRARRAVTEGARNER